MSNIAVCGLNVIATHILSAAQMRIPRFFTLSGFSPLFTVTHNVGIRRISPPHEWAAPIHRPPIILVVALLELSRDGLVSVQGWTVLNLLFGQIDGDVLLFFIHSGQRIGRDQYLRAGKPVSGVGDQVANRPIAVSYTH